MAESNEVWPPKPNKTPKEGVKKCPHCERALLTHSSPLCNWCGAVIDDPEYQAAAAEARQQRDAADKAVLEGIIQEEARYGVLGRLRRRAKSNPDNAKRNDMPDLEH